MRYLEIMEAKDEPKQVPVVYDPDDGHMAARFDERGHIYLNALYAGRKGGGEAMLRKLMAYADEHVLDIWLLADGDDKLVSYYRRFGFKMVGGHNNEMLRKATDPECGHPVELADDFIYDARDGVMEFKIDEFEGDDGETVRHGIILTKLEERRPGGANRMLRAALWYAHVQMYDLFIPQGLDPEIARKEKMVEFGGGWLKPRR